MTFIDGRTLWCRKNFGIIIILILGTLSLTWFRGNFLIDNFDIDIPLDPSRGLARSLYAWDENNALGSPNQPVIASIIPFQVLWVFLGNIFPLSIAEKVLFYLLFSCSGLSMYFLTTTLVKGRGREIAGLISAVFYMLNPYSMTFIWPQLTTFIFLYSFFPMLIALFIRTLNGRSIFRSAFTTCLIWSLTTTTAYQNPRFAVIMWITMILYLCYSVITKKELIHHIKQMTVLSILWLVLNSYWLLPNIAYLVQNYGNLSYEAIGLSDLSVFELNSAKILDIIRLSGYWALSSGFRGDPYYIWAGTFSSPIFLAISFLIPILSFLPLMFRPRDKNVIFFSFLALFGLFLVKGPNPPLGGINTWMVSKVTLLALLFRHNYEYFGIYIALSYAFLIGYGVACLSSSRIGAYEVAHNMKSMILTWKIGRTLILCSIFLLLFGVYAWPFWSGDLFHSGGNVIPSTRIKIPSYYQEADKWIQSLDSDFNMLSLPMSKLGYAAFWWNNGTDGYAGANPVVWLFSKPIIVAGSSGHQFSGYAAEQVVSNSTTDFGKMAALMNVRYVLFHRDCNWQYVQNQSTWITTSPEHLENILSHQSGLILEESFGELDFYRNDYWKPMFIYATTKSIVVYGGLSEISHIVEIDDFRPGESVLLLSDQLDARQISLVTTNTKFFQNGEYLESTHYSMELCSPRSLENRLDTEGILSSNPIDETSIIYDRINPTKYRVEVNSSKPCYLVFSESYHKDWIAYVDGQQVQDEYHLTANGFANAWYIDKAGTHVITLEFLPQRLLSIGLAMSVTTVVVCIVYIEKDKIKTIYKRITKQGSDEFSGRD